MLSYRLSLFSKFGSLTTVFDISNLFLGDNGFKRVIEETSRIDCNGFTELHMGGNMVTERSFPALVKLISLFPALKTLNFHSDRFLFTSHRYNAHHNNFRGLNEPLIKTITNSNITTLNFGYCNLNETDIRGLFNAYATTSAPSVEKLVFDGNSLSDAGAEEIAKGISNLKSLRELSLADCSLTVNGVSILITAAAKLQNPLHLSLRGNDCSGSATQLVEALNSGKLDYLDLSNCAIGENSSILFSSVKSFPRKLFLDHNDLTDVCIPVTCFGSSLSSTQTISLSFNHFTENYYKELSGYLAANKAKLSKLNLDHIQISPQVKELLKAALVKSDSKPNKKRKRHHRNSSKLSSRDLSRHSLNDSVMKTSAQLSPRAPSPTSFKSTDSLEGISQIPQSSSLSSSMQANAQTTTQTQGRSGSSSPQPGTQSAVPPARLAPQLARAGSLSARMATPLHPLMLSGQNSGTSHPLPISGHNQPMPPRGRSAKENPPSPSTASKSLFIPPPPPPIDLPPPPEEDEFLAAERLRRQNEDERMAKLMKKSTNLTLRTKKDKESEK